MNSAPAPAATANRADAALARGLAWLLQRQQPSGEFPLEVTSPCDGVPRVYPDRGIFPTALIGECLLALPSSPAIDATLDRACGFFLKEVRRGGLWSHFPDGIAMAWVCGPDADDTACVSRVLRARGFTEHLASNRRLLLLNRNRRGLFYTWFLTRFSWTLDREFWEISLGEWRHPRCTLGYWKMIEAKRNMAEGVVNANVVYYLGDIPETQAAIDFLVEIATGGNASRHDLWYHESNIIYYFFARNFAHGLARLEPARRPMIDQIRATGKPDGRLGETVLETVMGALALMHLGVPPVELAATASYLLAAQSPEGSWPRAPLYYGGPSHRTWWGSEEMTTAYCLEFFSRFQAA